jgi:hypothetical protein
VSVDVIVAGYVVDVEGACCASGSDGDAILKADVGLAFVSVAVSAAGEGDAGELAETRVGLASGDGHAAFVTATLTHGFTLPVMT